MYIPTRPVVLHFLNYSCPVLAVLGMWIRTANDGIQHHGIITAIVLNPATNQWIVLVTHTTPEKGVHESTLDEFAGDRPIALVAQPSTLEHQQMILATAQANLSQSYALFNKNCEHFASHCYTHRAQSAQLQVGVLLAAVVGVVAMTARSGRR